MLRRVVWIVALFHGALLLFFARERSEPAGVDEVPKQVHVATVQLRPKPPPIARKPAPKPKPKPKPKPQPKKPAPAAKKVVAPNPVSYRQELAERVQLGLCLPDYGTVRLELTLNRQGAVRDVRVLSSLSEENRDYVLAEVPRLHFIPFGDYFPGENEHTFCLSLSHDS